MEGEHRALLFCQSTQMLDIIQNCFGKWEINYLRLDGTTPANQRLALANEFNAKTCDKTFFLISTKAGGQDQSDRG